VQAACYVVVGPWSRWAVYAGSSAGPVTGALRPTAGNDSMTPAVWPGRRGVAPSAGEAARWLGLPGCWFGEERAGPHSAPSRTVGSGGGGGILVAGAWLQRRVEPIRRRRDARRPHFEGPGLRFSPEEETARRAIAVARSEKKARHNELAKRWLQRQNGTVLREKQGAEAKWAMTRPLQ
jgi:hypothetical protein